MIGQEKAHRKSKTNTSKSEIYKTFFCKLEGFLLMASPKENYWKRDQTQPIEFHSSGYCQPDQLSVNI